MALKTILNKQTDFTGEFPEEWAKGGLWRFNESDPDEDDCLLDSSGMGRVAYINNWSGTSASLSANRLGNYFRMNIVNPSSEQNYLKVTNDGSIFASLGARIVCGGWMNPTTYSVGNTRFLTPGTGRDSRFSTCPSSGAIRGLCSTTIPAL